MTDEYSHLTTHSGTVQRWLLKKPSKSGATDSIQLLPDEVLELTLDSRNGIMPTPTLSWGALILTSHRIIRHASDNAKNVSTILPLAKVTGVEIVDSKEPVSRLLQGLGAFAVGILLALLSWNILNVGLISLLVGGIPLIVSVYILAGYFFPEYESELVVSTAGSAVKHPLVTARAKADSLTAIDQLWKLIYGVRVGAVPTNSRGRVATNSRGAKNTSSSSSSSARIPSRARSRPNKPAE